jgi:ABC-2 type transport system permease protein
MSALDGTWTLVRLALRRDRIRLPLWILGVGGTVVNAARGLPGLYPTEAARASRAAFMSNPSAIAMTGPGHGLDDYTVGAIAANELGGFTAIAVALMSILLVTRHTRAEEEAGHAELLHAGGVGRFAAVVAALIVAGGASVGVGVVLALGIPTGGAELPVAGAMAFGAAMAAVGLVFAGVAAVSAQLTEHRRGASGIAVAALGVAFILRVLGDVGGGTLSWFSPIGWSQAVRAFVDERWWPLGLSLVATAALAACAFALRSRRDVGAAFVAPRPGRADASPALAGPLSLAVRVQRVSLLAWGMGLFVFGMLQGPLARDAEQFLTDNPQLERMFVAVEGASPAEQAFVSFLGFLAMLAAFSAVQSALRLRSEESAGRAGALLANPVPRWRWAGSHLAVTALGVPAVLAAGGFGYGFAYGVAAGIPDAIPRMVGAALAQTPAVWVLVGVAFALFGVSARAAPLAWGALAYVAFVWMIGTMVGLPAWMTDLSPLTHTPAVPAVELTIAPLLALLSIAAALAVVGLVGFERRDVAGVV